MIEENMWLALHTTHIRYSKPDYRSLV